MAAAARQPAPKWSQNTELGGLNLVDLPSEIRIEIFGNLPASSITAIQLTTKLFANEAQTVLYRSPVFASTFRLAQFTHTINQNPRYAVWVQCLNLSMLPGYGKYARAQLLLEQEQKRREAERAQRDIANRERAVRAAEAEQGIEYKPTRSFVKLPIPASLHVETTHQRSSEPTSTDHSAPWSPSHPKPSSPLRETVTLPMPVPLHVETSHRRSSNPKYTDLPAPWSSSHPSSGIRKRKASSPGNKNKPKKKATHQDHLYYQLLNQAITIPIGFLFHLLTNCVNLQTLDISHVVFDTDFHTKPYLRDCNFSRHEWDYLFTFKPTTRIYDPYQEITNRGAERMALHQQDLVPLILNLKHLKNMSILKGAWVTDDFLSQLSIRLKNEPQFLRDRVFFGKDTEVAKKSTRREGE